MEDEAKLFAAFERAPEFFETLSIFLDVDIQSNESPVQNEAERDQLLKLLHIIDEYQEQIYLLDPYLERMVTPIVDVFKAHVTQYTAARRSDADAPYSSSRLSRLTILLYTLIKSRGRKTIITFLPHQVADLPTALEYISASDGPAQIPHRWPLRYTVLLWISLICMIPFDLSKFDDNPTSSENESRLSTSQKIDALATGYLACAGLEREAAAVLLSKLYARKDTTDLLRDFLLRSTAFLESSPDISKTIGTLHVLCEITKSGIPDMVAPHVVSMRRALEVIETDPRLMNNTLVRKFKVKLEGRLTVGLIPPGRQKARKVRALRSDSDAQNEQREAVENDLHDADIPEEVEHGISTLLEGLQDKSTNVRYSASKHLARIASRLPLFLTQQILENVLHLFAIHSAPDGGTEDLPPVAEATWHGACLACAEMARRALIPREYLQQLFGWLKKALLFDIRVGAHSVGSSVRDAASYVIWALARSHDAEGMKSHSLSLAQRLVTVSLYDREVQIRRAASAAFQECVGRMNVFPHGIDVLRKTDFFAVGIRNNAFLVAAPQVAEHMEYRLALIDHLIEHTLIHWDSPMRLLGAKSLRVVCEWDLENLGPKVADRVASLLQSVDTNIVHGGLLGLSELASSFQAKGNMEEERLKIFKNLSRLPSSLIQKHSNEKIMEANCLFIASTISLSADLSPNSRWRTIVEQALRNREVDVQEAGAFAMRAFSKLADCSNDVKRYVKDFAKGTSAVQQGLARALGSLAYDRHDHAVHDALTCLLNGVDPVSTSFSSNVEARRNCYSAMSDILHILNSKIPQALDPQIVNRVLRAYILALDDYTTDERGDVGSWIRMACIRGLCSTVEVLFDLAPSLESHGSFKLWIPPETYQEVLGGILKQGVERLDNVRRQAGESFLKLLRKGPPETESSDMWKVPGHSLMRQLLVSDEEDVGWNEGQWLFPKAVRFLEVSEYRNRVLRGLVLSIGSKTDSTQRPVAASFTEYTGSLPVCSDNAGELDLLTITKDLLDLAGKNISSNNVVIPVLQTYGLILDAGVLDRLGENEEGVKTLNSIVEISTKNVPRLKNTQRILTSMKLISGLLAVPCVAEKAITILPQFLLHAFPKVRGDTAENIYLVMQGKDVGIESDEAEEILLETDWSISTSELEPKVENLVSIFRQDVNG